MTHPLLLKKRPRKHPAQGALLALMIAQACLPTPALAQGRLNNAADAPLLSERDPNLPDPATRSGWIRVEVAVLADDSSAATRSETWPATPNVRYPGKWRWLTHLAEPSALIEQYPGATVDVDELGAVTVTLPPPALPATESTAQMGSGDSNAMDPMGEPLADSTAPSPSIDPLTGRPEEALVSNAVPLEAIGAANPRPSRDDNIEDWLTPFAESNSLADAAASLENNDSEAADTPDSANAAPAFVAPPEPVAFSHRPTEMLAEGLRALTRRGPARSLIEAAWVQPPGEKNLPIVLDTSGDTAVWPNLQGFVELRRGNDLRVGVNFWLNTMGEYLPAGFAMDPPPRIPKRVTVAESAPQALLGTELGPGVDLAVPGQLRAPGASSMANGDRRDPALVEFIDPSTGMQVTGPAGSVSAGALTAVDGWPFRHLIQVADTRSVPENGVRYYDHPVVQVLVTWRELTWREVWALGEADASALEALAPSTAGDGNTGLNSAVPVTSPR